MTERNCAAAIPCARDGFTLIEMIMVIVVAGIMLAVAIPTFMRFSDRNALNSAAVAVSSLHARARISAIQRGRSTTLQLSPSTNQMWITSLKTTGSGTDTLGSVENLNTRFGLTFTSTSTSITFTPRGVSTATSATTIILSKGTKKDTLTITAAGRLI